MADWKGERVNQTPDEDGLMRHIRACTNARLPGDRLRFMIGEAQVGWVKPALADAMGTAVERQPGAVILADGGALYDLGRSLSDRGLFRFRREAFDVRATPGGPVLGLLDRGAIPSFGILAVGVHVNGLVRRPDGLHLWIGRRAADKALDPGKLDHIVAGGVPAGLSPFQTLVKEAGEEASIPPDLAAQARQVGTLSYAMERPEGLRRDLLHCYDLDLPEDFVPHGEDGEVESFELWPLTRALEAARDTDAFKFNVNLVLIDLFLRERLIAGASATRLRTALDTASG